MLSKDSDLAEIEQLNIFKKNHYINIRALLNFGTPHLQPNKTSDKFTRRDVQFYDLYVKKESGEELSRLKEHQFPLDINADKIYDDLEGIQDFNELFWNPKLIDSKFGKSIKVQANFDPKSKTLTRKVTEHHDLVKLSEGDAAQKSSPDKKRNADDTE